MDASSEQTVEAVKRVVGCFKDGFQFSDILTATRTAVEIAETITALDGAGKKAFVVDVIGKAYREVDPDIPWIPAFVETWIEDYVLDNLVPAVIELLIAATKGKIAVNEPSE